MSEELWGVGSDARRVARPVVLCATLGIAAFGAAFSGALLLGRGFAGSALAAVLVPLALSGALAVGLAVVFVVAVALEQPFGARRVARLVPVVTPLAALVALFAYASDPATPARGPAPGPVVVAVPSPSVAVPGGRTVSVPHREPVRTVAGPVVAGRKVTRPAPLVRTVAAAPRVREPVARVAPVVPVQPAVVVPRDLLGSPVEYGSSGLAGSRGCGHPKKAKHGRARGCAHRKR